MRRIRRPTKPATTIFLLLLGVTVTVWILRGLGLLTFIPGGIIWLLLLLTISAAVISRVQRVQT
ncbi:hypothetical protein H6G89_32135 [Oscillatoria sp. FACHB-1407]|uniref:hypothetical protein n=1 Tax=Oscillatoria sp. FACHB-1407 TaxID=2692847 RepID=UPI0016873E10|nr:hypothetical protein [Oscillatoria sp. FACHB-1407]MBD2465644.1 hypothetical protein [Oscillatoria sp. FACHB-1407]